MSNFEEYKRVNTRRASVLNLGGFQPTGDILESNFCLFPVAEVVLFFKGEVVVKYLYWTAEEIRPGLWHSNWLIIK